MCFNKSESNPRGAGLTEYYSGDDGKLKALMATQSSLESFNPAAESIEDYKERFDFHCTAHQIPEGRRKALFLTRIGRDAFAKLKTLVSPTPLNDLSLSAIVTTMTQHYKKDTVEIAERFKFFKRVQQERETGCIRVKDLVTG